MLSKMSKRERLIALVAAALLPIFLVMFLVIYVGGNLSDRSARISGLNDEQRQLNLRLAIARRVAARGDLYRSESLPSDANQDELAYQAWFADLSERTLGKQNINVTMGFARPVRFNLNEVVYNSQAFSINGKCTLRQLVAFMYGFYEARILHRISMFSLVPDTEGTGARQRLTGRLRFNISFEVVSIAAADPNRDFSNDRRPMLRTLQEYQDIVARRDVFGPPNEAPKLATGGSTEFETGEAISVVLQAADGNKDQDLVIEMVEKSSAEATLVQSEPTSATFNVPPLPLGDHKFLFRATDNGWPCKSSDLAVTISVVAPQPDTEPEPPPQYARYAFISGITTNISGQPVVWIRVPQPDDELHRLTVGESFRLDEKEWTIREIADDQIIIEVDGENRVYRVRNFLHEPLRPPVSAAARK